MNDIVRLVLSLSMSGCILAATVMIIKLLAGRSLSKRFQYLLWILVILRMAIPLSLEGSLVDRLFDNSEAALDNQVEKDRIDITPDLLEGIPAPTLPADGSSQTNTVSGSEVISSFGTSVDDKVERGDYNDDIFYGEYFRVLFSQLVFDLWLAPVLLILIYHVGRYALFMNRLRRSLRLPDAKSIRVYGEVKGPGRGPELSVSGMVETPMLIGLVRPRIILPDIVYSEEALRHVLSHEMIHYRHKDIWIKWLVMMTCALHWFNPMVYLLRKEVEKNCELACDEAVINHMTGQDKQSYGQALILAAQLSANQRRILRATLAEDKKGLMGRLQAIMDHRRPPVRMRVISVILAVMVMSVSVISGCAVIQRKADTKEDTSNIQDTSSIEDNGSLGDDSGTEDVGDIGVNSSIQDITEIRSQYVGDASNTSRIVGALPVFDDAYTQRFISLNTDNSINSLTIYYEPKSSSDVPPLEVASPFLSSTWKLRFSMETNALVVFAMIENVDEVIFAVRMTPSEGELETEDYTATYKYGRVVFESLHGEVYERGAEMESLQELLHTHRNLMYDRSVESAKPASDDLMEDYKIFINTSLDEIMSSPMESSNPWDYIKAHQDVYDAIMVKNWLTYDDKILKLLNEEIESYTNTKLDKTGIETLRGHLLRLLQEDMTKMSDY